MGYAVVSDVISFSVFYFFIRYIAPVVIVTIFVTNLIL